MSLTIILPMAAKNLLTNEIRQPYPVALFEINSKPIIQLVVQNLSTIKEDKNFIFILNDEECNKYHLDNSLRLITEDPHEIVILHGETKGALCSCLMSIDNLDPETELIIANADQIFDDNLNQLLQRIREDDSDAAVLTFRSIHPRWSYANIDPDNKVIETAEKNPISHFAIAGFYYFRKAKFFIDAAMKSIKKGASIDERYYTAPSINELILSCKTVNAYEIDKANYHTFYSLQKIREFEANNQS
jgi:dTDP-glucose pyrophosphorylase